MQVAKMAPLTFGIACLLVTTQLFHPAQANAAVCSAIQTAVTELSATECGKYFCAGSTSGVSGGGAVDTSVDSAKPPPVVARPDDVVQNDPIIGTYYPAWFVYRKHYMGPYAVEKNEEGKEAGDPVGGEFHPFDARPLMPKVTHFFYSFLNVDFKCRIAEEDPAAAFYDDSAHWIKWASPGMCKGLMSDFVAIKKEYPHVNLMMSLGGWTYSMFFSKCAGTPEGRQSIYKTFEFYMRTWDPNWGKSGGAFTGVDFDWEHPGTDAGASYVGSDFYNKDNDWKNYALLINDFRKMATAAGRTLVQVSSAIGMGVTLDVMVDDHPEDGKAFCEALDFLNLMTYDIHGKWQPETGHNAPFCADGVKDAWPQPDLHWDLHSRVTKIVSICGWSKLNFGIPNYSHAWTDVPDNGKNGLYQKSTAPAGTSFARWSTFSEESDSFRSQGVVAFWDMQKLVTDANLQLKVHKHDCIQDGITIPVKYVYSKERKLFASYEDEETVEAKITWARARGMRGFFFWDTQQDKEGKLIDAGRRAYPGLKETAATGVYSNANCIPPSQQPDLTVFTDGTKPFVGCKLYKDKVKHAKFIIGPFDGCAKYRTAGQKVCNGWKPVLRGMEYLNDDKVTWRCSTINTCTPLWDNKDLWANGYAHIACPGDENDPTDKEVQS